MLATNVFLFCFFWRSWVFLFYFVTRGGANKLPVNDINTQWQTANIDKECQKCKRNLTSSFFLKAFLTKFGYLAPLDFSRTRTREELKKAVSLYQKAYGLKETGKLTKEQALTMTHVSRCGLSDVGPVERARKRRKRYALQGTKWYKKVSVVGYSLSFVLFVILKHLRLSWTRSFHFQLKLEMFFFSFFSFFFPTPTKPFQSAFSLPSHLW